MSKIYFHVVFKRLRRILLLGLVWLIVSCENQQNYELSVPIYHTGDNINWNKKEYDDTDWKYTKGKTGDSIFWIRVDVKIKKDPEFLEPLGINLNAFGAYEVYWDEVLIGVNGKPGQENTYNKKSEVNRYFMIPDSLSKKGDHIMALRSSQYFLKDHERVFRMDNIKPYQSLIRTPLIITAFMHILAGAFFIAAIYYFILYFNDRKDYPTLLFSISCFLFFMLIILEYMKFYTPIHYTQFYTRLEIIGVLILIIAFLIPFYFSIQFSFNKKKVFFLFYTTLLLYIYIANLGLYDASALILGQSMWIASLIIVGYAALKKINGSVVVLVGLLTSALVDYFLHYDISLFLSFTIILLCMLYVLAIRIRSQRKAYEYSIVQSTRLKHELLKKKIQPHFLMNTLTSLIDWVEESPEKGVAFIEALADEFDLLNQIEDKSLIPISQEIQLCLNHLNIMKYRTEIEYIWEDEGIDSKQKIPPALIHTLLENGITHCLPQSDGTIRFKLTYKSVQKYHFYEFLTFAKIRIPRKETKEGTGIKYLKSRLNESYNLQWDFSSEPAKNGWKNIIKIYK